MTDQEDREFWSILWSEALRALTLGWDLAIPIFAGVFLGHLADNYFGTSPTFTLGLLVLGVMIAYYNLGRVISRLAAHDRRKKERLEQEEKEVEQK